jgi:hypothetical protein
MEMEIIGMKKDYGNRRKEVQHAHTDSAERLSEGPKSKDAYLKTIIRIILYLLLIWH